MSLEGGREEGYYIASRDCKVPVLSTLSTMSDEAKPPPPLPPEAAAAPAADSSGVAEETRHEQEDLRGRSLLLERGEIRPACAFNARPHAALTPHSLGACR